MYHKTKMYGIHCKEEALRFFFIDFSKWPGFAELILKQI